MQTRKVRSALLSCLLTLPELWLCPANFQARAPERGTQKWTEAAQGLRSRLLRVGRPGICAINSSSIYSACFNHVSLHGKQTSSNRETGISGICLLIPGTGSESRWGGTFSEQLPDTAEQVYVNFYTKWCRETKMFSELSYCLMGALG